MKDFILFDKYGNKYTIAELDKKEVCYIINKLIVNMLIATQDDSKLLLAPHINLNMISDIFLKLKTWRTLDVEIMSLIKNGEQEDLVDITTLKCIKELNILKTLGKSFLQTEVFQKKILSWNQENNNI